MDMLVVGTPHPPINVSNCGIFFVIGVGGRGEGKWPSNKNK